MSVRDRPSLALDARTKTRLRRALCLWFDREQRDLPWRRTSDPYAIWISETMLQQTRVETVIAAYERFLARFPDVERLAAASEDEVLALWSGLGYYRRARALREAAQVIARKHGGRFPAERSAVLDLPGIGPYTAGAVLSIAFGLAEPLVDGNVARVLSRLFDVHDELESSASKRTLWALARALVPKPARAAESPVHPAHWNQGLMELGALVCTPTKPRCLVCPLHRDCRARERGTAEQLPRRAPKRKAIEVRLEILVVERDGAWLLRRREAGGRMAGLYEFPTREVPTSAEGEPLLWPAAYPDLAGAGRYRLKSAETLGELSHGITHHRIQAAVHRGSPPPVRWNAQEPWRLVPAELFPSLGLTGLAKKVLRRFLPAEGPGAKAAPS